MAGPKFHPIALYKRGRAVRMPYTRMAVELCGLRALTTYWFKTGTYRARLPTENFDACAGAEHRSIVIKNGICTRLKQKACCSKAAVALPNSDFHVVRYSVQVLHTLFPTADLGWLLG